MERLFVEEIISVEVILYVEVLLVEVNIFVSFSIVGESVFRRSRNDDSLDGEFTVWNVGSYLEL